MKRVTITCQIQFDVNGNPSNENIVSTIYFINKQLEQLSLNCEPQIMIERETDFLINYIEPINK